MIKDKLILLKTLFHNCFKEIGISQNIWLSIDILNILSALKIRNRNDIQIILDLIYSLIIENTNNNNLIIIPSFFFSFPQKGIFHTLESKPELGSFPNYLFNKKYKYRTIHPLYSFYVFGKNKEQFLEETKFLNDSVGNKSIFNYLNKNRFTSLSIGHHYVASIPSIHYCEYLLKAEFRDLIWFSGKLIDPSRGLCIEGKFNFFGRKKYICDFSGVTETCVDQLLLNKISSQYSFQMDKKSIAYYIVDLFEFHEYIINNHNSNNLLFNFTNQENGIYNMVIDPAKSREIYKKFI